METSLTTLTVRTQDEVLVTLPLNEKDGGREVSRNSKSSSGSSGPAGVVCCEQVCVSITCRDDGEGPDFQDSSDVIYT
jgi:hypothetical protein